MRKICVYTCITGEYDKLNEIKKPEKGVDYVCFTNNVKLKSKTWKVIQIHELELSNRLLARKIKILGHPTINKKYEVFVWTDADVIWERAFEDFVEFLGEKDFAVFMHHSRIQIYEEAVACLENRKDTIQNIQKVLKFYKKIGYPDNNGLFESTVFVRKNTAEVLKMLKEWYKIVAQYTERDQLSLPYAIWKTGLEISPIKLNVWDNDWFKTVRHTIKSSASDCHIYYGNRREEDFNFEHYHVKQYARPECYEIEDIIPITTKRIEINPTNLAGTLVTKINIAPKPNKIESYGAIAYKDKLAFCSSCNVIVLNGKFQQGDKLSIKLSMRPMAGEDVVEFSENAWLQNAKLINENFILKEQKKTLETTLQEIYQSKSWKLIRKIRELLLN